MPKTVVDLTEGFHFEDTLTGFKWIGSRAAALHGSRVAGIVGENYHSSSSSGAADNGRSSDTATTGDTLPEKTYKTLFCYEEASK